MKTLLLLLGCLCAALAVACGGDDASPAASPTAAATRPPEATATQAPTQTPEPTSEPTQEPSPLPPAATAAPRGGGGGGGSAPPAPAGPVTVVAQNLQFVNSSVRGRAGSVTLVLDNRDTLVAHNITVDGFGASPDCSGPCTTTLSFTAGPGTYRFVCTIHPDMAGGLSLAP